VSYEEVEIPIPLTDCGKIDLAANEMAIDFDKPGQKWYERPDLPDSRVKEYEAVYDNFGGSFSRAEAAWSVPTTSRTGRRKQTNERWANPLRRPRQG
jgi:hypothetical protein